MPTFNSIQALDWLMLAVFAVPTAVLACVWAARDLKAKSELWPVRSGSRGMALYWMRDIVVVLLLIGMAAGAAVFLQLLLR